MNIRTIESEQYRKALHNAQKVNWNIDTDVIRFRQLDTAYKFLPDSLSLVQQLPFLSDGQRRFFSQVQGRTYSYLFGLVERYIVAAVLDLSHEHSLGDQDALAAMLQFGQEEMKHQELFRRAENLAAAVMPSGYTKTADPDAVAHAVLSKSAWAVLALTCHVEIFTQAHYLHSIKDGDGLSPLFKDIFRFHWMEEAQHATLDELEWQRVHDTMQPTAIDAAVTELIELVGAVDGILQAQAAADGEYFRRNAGSEFSAEQRSAIDSVLLKAYRLQYIVSGVRIERFQRALAGKVTPAQMARIQSALTPLVTYVDG
jgi:hypothetical protein